MRVALSETAVVLFVVVVVGVVGVVVLVGIVVVDVVVVVTVDVDVVVGGGWWWLLVVGGGCWWLLVGVCMCTPQLRHANQLPQELVCYMFARALRLCAALGVSWPEREVIHNDTVRRRSTASMTEAWVPPSMVASAVLQLAQDQGELLILFHRNGIRQVPSFLASWVKHLMRQRPILF